MPASPLLGTLPPFPKVIYKPDKEVVVLMYNGISLSHEINVIRLVAAR